MRANVSTPPQLGSEGHWPLLDAIRFGAALLVLFGHTRGLLLEGIGHVEHPNALIRAFYLISGLQHEGVVMFFVVSGFLVGGSAWRLIAADRFKFRVYFINRFSRIYIVFVPAIIMVLLVNAVGMHFFLDTRFYGVRPLLPSAVSNGWTWGQIPCYLFCLQGLLCQPYGADPPLWSLGYEWALYLVGPAVFSVLHVRTQRRVIWLALVAVVFVTLTWWNDEWPTWFAFWILGAVAARLLAHHNIGLPIALAGAVACGAGLVLSRLAIVPLLATDAVIAGGLCAIASCRSLMNWTWGDGLVRSAAGFSYSLYIIHLPICVFIGALLERVVHWPRALVQPDQAGVTAFAVMVAIALLAARVFAFFTEQNTAALRKWLFRTLPNEWRARVPGSAVTPPLTQASNFE